MKFSVVIATWNESSQIASSLKRLRQISQSSPMEIIVVDGGSDDGTPEAAKEWADHVIVHEKPNRGKQLDEGARKATGDLLFFLRPDAQPPGNWQQALEHFWLATHTEKIAATAFSVDYGSARSLRWASALSNAAVSWRGAVSGEHGLCTTPDVYRDSGGFPPIAYREDIVFCGRLEKHGKIVLLKERIWPAGRRMHRAGAFKTALQDVWLTLRFKLGAKPEDLWRSDAGL
jgi:glycosyltransferase involved in cell wall biosynthesis